MNKYNEIAFTPDEVDKNMHMDLLRYLTEANEKYDNRFNEIHITNDGYCTIIQWLDRNYNEGNECARFEFIDYDQVIMTEHTMPDGVRVTCETEEEYKDILAEFMKDHQDEYKQNEWGHWYSVIEEEAVRKSLGLDNEEETKQETI